MNEVGEVGLCVVGFVVGGAAEWVLVVCMESSIVCRLIAFRDTQELTFDALLYATLEEYHAITISENESLNDIMTAPRANS